MKRKGLRFLGGVVFGVMLFFAQYGGIEVRAVDSPEILPLSSEVKVELNGKKVLFDGDSIARGYYAYGPNDRARIWSYAGYLENEAGIIKTKLAHSGAKFYWPDADTDSGCSGGTEKCVIHNHLTPEIMDEEFDYIILEGGVNDFTGRYRSSKELIKEALREYLNVIVSNPNWKGTKIGFVIIPEPDHVRRGYYGMMEWEREFWKGVQEICDEYSVKYLNFMKQSEDDDFIVPDGFRWDFMQIDVNNAEEVGSFDGLHPSKGGQNYLGYYIANWMASELSADGQDEETPSDQNEPDVESQEEIEVPNTAASGSLDSSESSGIGKPNTGRNTDDDIGEGRFMLCILPIIVAGLMLAVRYRYFGKNKHRKF